MENLCKHDYWEGVPEEYRYMLLANIRSSEDYCTPAIISYLLDHMNDYVSYEYDVLPYDILRLIDLGIENCFFPVELHEKAWIVHKEELQQLINKSRELLERYAPSNYKTGRRRISDDNLKYNIIAIHQKLKVYECVLYMHMERWCDFQKCIKEILVMTKENLNHLVTLYEPEQILREDEASDTHYIGLNKWDLMYWVSQETMFNSVARSFLEGEYEVLDDFLNDTINESGHSFPEYLIIKNGQRYRDICNYDDE